MEFKKDWYINGLIFMGVAIFAVLMCWFDTVKHTAPAAVKAETPKPEFTVEPQKLSGLPGEKTAIPICQVWGYHSVLSDEDTMEIGKWQIGSHFPQAVSIPDTHAAIIVPKEDVAKIKDLLGKGKVFPLTWAETYESRP